MLLAMASSHCPVFMPTRTRPAMYNLDVEFLCMSEAVENCNQCGTISSRKSCAAAGHPHSR